MPEHDIITDKQPKKIALNADVQALLAGGIAGAVSRTAVAPLIRTKILFQVQGKQAPLRFGCSFDFSCCEY
jgi:hypothetical protein